VFDINLLVVSGGGAWIRSADSTTIARNDACIFDLSVGRL